MKLQLNDNFARIKPSYLFSDVAKRVRAYAEAHPGTKILRLGIGDVTLPLTPTVIRALHKATDEMADQSTFRGYAPEYGYDFLREAVSRHYASFGVSVEAGDVFISDGAKSDLGNFVDLFGDVTVLVPDPEPQDLLIGVRRRVLAHALRHVGEEVGRFDTRKVLVQPNVHRNTFRFCRG